MQELQRQLKSIYQQIFFKIKEKIKRTNEKKITQNKTTKPVSKYFFWLI